jgi:hypothetical protein
MAINPRDVKVALQLTSCIAKMAIEPTKPNVTGYMSRGFLKTEELCVAMYFWGRPEHAVHPKDFRLL